MFVLLLPTTPITVHLHVIINYRLLLELLKEALRLSALLDKYAICSVSFRVDPLCLHYLALHVKCEVYCMAHTSDL